MDRQISCSQFLAVNKGTVTNDCFTEQPGEPLTAEKVSTLPKFSIERK